MPAPAPAPGVPRYHPSGRTGVPRLVPALLLALGAAGGLAVTHAAALRALPATIALAAPLTLAVGLAVAALAGLAARLGHVRAPALAAVLGALLGAATDAAGFVATARAYPEALHAALVHEDAELRRRDTQLRKRVVVDGHAVFEPLPVRPPAPTLDAMRTELPLAAFPAERLATGFSLRAGEGTSIRGGLVVAAWLAELLVLAGLGALGGLAAARRPFCEACRRFATDRATRLVHDVDVRAVRAAADEGRREDVLALPRDPKAGRSVRLDGLSCASCRDGVFLDATILPPGTRGARPGPLQAFLGGLRGALRRERPPAERDRTDTHLLDRSIWTAAERERWFPSTGRRPTP